MHIDIKNVLNLNKLNINSLSFTNVPSSRVIDLDLENLCQKKWQEIVNKAKLENKKIWDSEIYRFEGFKKKDDLLNINISTIPFSIRYSMNSYTEKIKNLGINYTPLGMFTSCFLLTKDNKYLFIQKSNQLYFDRNISFIGGILSKNEKKLNSDQDLFDEVKKEINEEIRIDYKNINLTNFKIGYITENLNFCLLFSIKLEQKYNDIYENFHNTGKYNEASDIIGINAKKIAIFAKQNFPEKDLVKFKLMKLI